MKHYEKLVPIVAAGVIAAGCGEDAPDLQFKMPPPANVVAIDCYDNPMLSEAYKDTDFAPEPTEQATTLGMVAENDKTKLIAGVAIQGIGAHVYRFATSDRSLITLDLDEGLSSFSVPADERYNLSVAAGLDDQRTTALFVVTCMKKTRTSV